MTTLKLPPTHLLKTQIWAKIFPGDPKPYLLLSPGDMKPHGYFKLQDVELEIPLEWGKISDPTNEQVEAIKEEIRAVRAKSESTVTNLQGEISNLLALTFEPVESQQ